MLEAISNGIAFADRISFIEFSEDERTKYAVIRAIEIIGEASKKVPLEIKSQYLEIPWRGMSGMRDKLIHDYFGIDVEIVWATVKDDLPRLKMLLTKMKKELNK